MTTNIDGNALWKRGMNSQTYYLYYTDTIGLIKKELIVNNVIAETWNLTSYNTILLEPQ